MQMNLVTSAKVWDGIPRSQSNNVLKVLIPSAPSFMQIFQWTADTKSHIPKWSVKYTPQKMTPTAHASQLVETGSYVILVTLVQKLAPLKWLNSCSTVSSHAPMHNLHDHLE